MLCRQICGCCRGCLGEQICGQRGHAWTNLLSTLQPEENNLRTNLRTKAALCGQHCGHLRTSADECADRHHDLRSEMRPVDRSGSLWTSLWTHRQSADKTADEFADRLAICREKCGQIGGAADSTLCTPRVVVKAAESMSHHVARIHFAGQ